MNTQRPSDIIISESPFPKLNTPLQIDESILCLGDLQIPYHDAEFITHCVQVAHAFGVRTCGWIGDVFDLHALSIFLSRQTKDLGDELDYDEMFGAELAAQFDKIYFCNGNHELRAAHALMQWLPVERLTKLIGLGDNVIASDYFYYYIGDKWEATHPGNSSINAGMVPKKLAPKYRRNVLSFHGHGVGAVMENDYWCIDVGMCADRERLEYTQLRQNTRPMMQLGAALMLRDECGIYHPRLLNGMTDWDLEKWTGEKWQRNQRQSSQARSSRKKSNQSAKTRKRKR